MGKINAAETENSQEHLLQEARELLANYQNSLRACEIVLAVNKNASLLTQQAKLQKLIRDTQDVIAVLEKD